MDLGGTSDTATAPILADYSDLCEPCSTSRACPKNASCVKIGGDVTFCATSCPKGDECDSDDTCAVVATNVGGSVHACIPNGGQCSPAKGPNTDGAPFDSCGELVGPPLSSICSACRAEESGCQPNGCYGGWWCNSSTAICERPPRSCSR